MALTFCSYSGLVPQDSQNSALVTQNATTCNARIESLVANAIQTNQLFLLNENNELVPITAETMNNLPIPIPAPISSTRYYGLGQMLGSASNYFSGEYIALYNTTNLVTNFDVIYYIAPFTIGTLRTIMSVTGNDQDIGNFSVQMADINTGLPLPGVNQPVIVGNTANIPGIIATHTLNPSMPAGTSFAIRLAQSINNSTSANIKLFFTLISA